MPYSYTTFDPFVAALLGAMRPASMLDIGPGAGKYGKIIRQIEKSHSFRCKKTAVEINPAYINQFALNSIYDEIWQQDASGLVTTAPDLAGDLVVMGDVIEHIPKSRGVDLLDYLMYRFRHMLIVFPIDLPQGAWEGHAAEAHISLWYPEDFLRYGGSTYKVDTGEGWSMCLALMNGVFLKPAEQIRIAENDGQLVITKGTPKHA